MTCSQCPHCLAEIARLDGELAKARMGLTPIAEVPQHIIELAIAIGERDEARMALDMATGPHCSSCGNAIDLETCWCGDGPPSKHVDETHGFIPMGCDCSRAFEDRDWMKCASELRSRLWQASKERDEARASLAQLAAINSDVNAALNRAGIYCAITFAEAIDQIAKERDEALARVAHLEASATALELGDQWRRDDIARLAGEVSRLKAGLVAMRDVMVEFANIEHDNFDENECLEMADKHLGDLAQRIIALIGTESP